MVRDFLLDRASTPPVQSCPGGAMAAFDFKLTGYQKSREVGRIPAQL
jgi:hypothetical protein